MLRNKFVPEGRIEVNFGNAMISYGACLLLKVAKKIFMRNLKAIDWAAIIAVIAGGLNWGLVGLLNFDLFAYFFGFMAPTARIAYVLVGLSAIYTTAISSELIKRPTK